MFHYSKHLYFGFVKINSAPNGGFVRIIKFATEPAEFPRIDQLYPEAAFDVIIDADGWRSIVAHIAEAAEK